MKFNASLDKLADEKEERGRKRKRKREFYYEKYDTKISGPRDVFESDVTSEASEISQGDSTSSDEAMEINEPPQDDKPPKKKRVMFQKTNFKPPQ